MAAAGIEVDLLLHEKPSRAMVECTGKWSGKQWKEVLGLDNDGHRSRKKTQFRSHQTRNFAFS